MHASLRNLAFAGLAVLIVGCGSKGDDDPPATAGSGGTSGTGGDTSAGGTATAGGTGGATSAGGTSSTETSSSTGGSAGSAGAPPEPELAFGFDADVEGWDVLYTSSDPSVDPVDPTEVEVAWSEDGGDPGGALSASIPFEAKSQYVGFGVIFGESALDLTRHRIVAQVKIESGVGEVDDLESAPANAKIYAKSGETYVYANGPLLNVFGDGEWVEVEFDLHLTPNFVDETNGTFDPSDIRELGIQIDTNSQSSTAQPGVVLFDNIAY